MSKFRIDVWNIFTNTQDEFFQRFRRGIHPTQFLNECVLMCIGIRGFDLEAGIFKKMEKFVAPVCVLIKIKPAYICMICALPCTPAT